MVLITWHVHMCCTVDLTIHAIIKPYSTDLTVVLQIVTLYSTVYKHGISSLSLILNYVPAFFFFDIRLILYLPPNVPLKLIW